MSQDLDCVVKAIIHPAIGVARVSNSTDPDGYYLAPEVPRVIPSSTDVYRGKDQAIERQANGFGSTGWTPTGTTSASSTPAMPMSTGPYT